MNNFEETIKNLQKMTESMGNMGENSYVWQSINQMQKMLDSNFWDNILQLANSTESRKPDQSKQQDILVPKIDVYQTENKLAICCEIPGLDEDSLEYSLSNSRSLIVKGKIKPRPFSGYMVRKERHYGKFYRHIKLPQPVMSHGMRVSYNAGILEILLIKKQRDSGEKSTFP